MQQSKLERVARRQDEDLEVSTEVAPELGADNALSAVSEPVDEPPRLHPRLQAMMRAARHHGVELDPKEFKQAEKEEAPTAASLSLWAQNSGLWSRALRIPWRHLMRFQETGPVVLLFTDGSAGLVTGASPQQFIVYLQDPYAVPGTPPVAVDELRMAEVWAGGAVLL